VNSIAGKNVVLIGFMGTGKTEVGRLLAKALSRRFVDTDAWIEKENNMTVQEIFATLGEAAFRQKEAEALAVLCGQKGLVLATGGGIILNPQNVVLLRETGFVIWLDAGLEELARRLAGDNTRPLLAGGVDFRDIYRRREKLYRNAAHVRIDTTGKTPLVVSDEIQALLRQDGA